MSLDQKIRKSLRKGGNDMAMRAALSMGGPGNARRLAEAAETPEEARDLILRTITSRLGHVALTQEAEIAQTQARPHRDWWRHEADSWEDRVSDPEPERWAPVAQAYRRAADAAVRGDVPRAAGLLRLALQQEEAVQDATTDLVDKDRSVPDSPLGETAPAGPCTRTTMPEEIAQLSARIERVRDASPDSPVRHVRDGDEAMAQTEDEDADDAAADR